MASCQWGKGRVGAEGEEKGVHKLSTWVLRSRASKRRRIRLRRGRGREEKDEGGAGELRTLFTSPSPPSPLLESNIVLTIFSGYFSLDRAAGGARALPR